jgi:hypothetical protein
LRDTKITVVVLALGWDALVSASNFARAIGQLGQSFSCPAAAGSWLAEAGTTQQRAARRSNFLVCFGIDVLLDGSL